MKESEYRHDGIESLVVMLIDKSIIHKMSETHLFYCIYYLFLLDKTKKHLLPYMENIIWDSYYPSPYSNDIKNKIVSSTIIKSIKISDSILGYELVKEHFKIKIATVYIDVIEEMKSNGYLDNITRLREKCIKLEEDIYENKIY